MAFKSLYEAKTVKIHVLGQKAEGDLKRPFKSGPGLFGGMSLPSLPGAAAAYHLLTQCIQPLRTLRPIRPPSKRPKNVLALRKSDKVFFDHRTGDLIARYILLSLYPYRTYLYAGCAHSLLPWAIRIQYLITFEHIVRPGRS